MTATALAAGWDTTPPDPDPFLLRSSEPDETVPDNVAYVVTYATQPQDARAREARWHDEAADNFEARRNRGRR